VVRWTASAFGELGVVAIIVGVPRRENSVRRSIDGAAGRQFQRRHLQGIAYLCWLENFLHGRIVDNECHVTLSTGSAGLTGTEFICVLFCRSYLCSEDFARGQLYRRRMSLPGKSFEWKASAAILYLWCSQED
jgi:hypothetical protein